MGRRKDVERRRTSADATRRAVETAPVAPGTAGATPERLAPRRWAVWIGFALAVVVAGYAAYVGVGGATRTSRPASLPALPDLSQQPQALRQHLAEADRAARAEPTSVEAVSALCVAYHADMFYAEAQQCYAMAETMDGANWRWTYYRALARGEMGDSEGLVDGLRGVTRAAPDFSPAWWRLGDAEFKAGAYDRAGEAWQRVVSLPAPAAPQPDAGSPVREPVAPLSAYARMGLARIALVHGDAERARAMLEDVTAQAPRFGPAFRLLGDAYASLQRPEDAARAVHVADNSPTYDPYVDPTMDLLVRESRNSTFLLQQASATDISTSAAWREFLIRRALEYDPSNTDALYELSALLRALKRYEEALEPLERYRALVPDDHQVFADIGRCYSGLQRYTEAERALRQALEDLDDANTRYDLALVLDRSGRLDEAIAEYQRALDRNPNHRDSLNNLGVAYVRQGRLADAVGLFERLVAADPANANAHTNLGVVFLTQGKRDLAAREFRAALAISPTHAVAQEGLKKLQP